ncbi:MAG: tRNA preQ1(34) S-adenosylmethionine ribosyltransferase-isomerase QueA [Gammaproteobacteria bacterium]|nr:tRNA preQ1(34) S-adenosylmethionine ribosyltransferase-isomerase QueA [Gammaproteobacteria bacterium]
MHKADFNFELPEGLIAQAPLARRSDSRLLLLDPVSPRLEDRGIRDLPTLLAPGDLLVFNDTKVLPARLRGRKDSGGAVELLIERHVSDTEVLAWLRASKSPRTGSSLEVAGSRVAVLGREAELYRLAFDQSVMALLERHGEVPLPPYIRRPNQAQDRERYQSVFARVPGSAAAPTASLHFDAALLAALAQRGIEHCFVTLHVGAGTFAPVRSEQIEGHRLHRESLEVDDQVCAAVARTQARGGRVVAIGTTAVRALETAAAGGALADYRGDTELFIYPGYAFRVVDAMVTNFHLPESSLLMLVCAFAGREPVLAAYRHAVAQRYRFFSYGDAMLVFPAARLRETAP